MPVHDLVGVMGERGFLGGFRDSLGAGFVCRFGVGGREGGILL
jgi:hypothetical protein